MFDSSGLFLNFCLAGCQRGFLTFPVGALARDGVSKYLLTFSVRGVLPGLCQGGVDIYCRLFWSLSDFLFGGCQRGFQTFLFGRSYWGGCQKVLADFFGARCLVVCRVGVGIYCRLFRSCSDVLCVGVLEKVSDSSIWTLGAGKYLPTFSVEGVLQAFFHEGVDNHCRPFWWEILSPLSVWRGIGEGWVSDFFLWMILLGRVLESSV